MGWIVLVCCIILLFMNFNINPKRLINATTFFLSLWTFILFLSCLNLFELDMPSDNAYLLILSMIVCFFIGSIIGDLSSKYRFSIKVSQFGSNKEVRGRVFVILLLITFALLLYDYSIVFRYFLNGTPLWQIRNWTLEPYGSDNPILLNRTFLEQCLRVLVVTPFVSVFYPFVVYYYLSPKYNKYRVSLLVISFLYLVLSSVTTGGGRLAIVCYVLYFIFAFSVFSQGSKFDNFDSRKYKNYIFGLMGVGILFVVMLSAYRNGVGFFLREAYIYFALPPTLLDKWLIELENGQYTYGFLTLFGLHSCLFRALDYMGLTSLVPDTYEIAYQWILNAESWKFVGSGINNAFVTPVYYFYKDGGILSVCVFSTIFGVLTERMNNRFTKNINVGSFVLYSLLMYGVFISFMRIQTCIPSYIISFIMAFYLFDCNYSKSDSI